MLNILKKVEGLRHGDGGTKTNSLEPPANLPELARDMYEHEQIATIHNDTTSSTENGLKNLDGQNKNIQNINTNLSQF